MITRSAQTLVVLVFSLIFSLVQVEGAPPPTLELGASAPDFTLPGVDGKMHSLNDYADAKILTIIFTCNHCPTAQYYEERIKKLVADYRSKGVAFVAISPNDAESVRPDELGYTDLGDTLEEMKIRAAYKEFNFPYLFGGGEYEPVSLAYGPVVTPHVFIFDAARKLRYVGRIDDAEREEYVTRKDTRLALDALLAGEEPPVTKTKVVGCSTKWSDKRPGVATYWDRYNAEPVEVEMADAAALAALRANQTAPGEDAKFRLVNFWATWCGPCVTEFPDLMEINRWYRGRDFELVTVAANYPDEKDQVLKFLKKEKAATRNLLYATNRKYELMEAFDPDWDGGMPYTVLINPQGEIIYKSNGAIEPLEMKRAIVKALNSHKPW